MVSTTAPRRGELIRPGVVSSLRENTQAPRMIDPAVRPEHPRAA
jgi:hypothetical protein